MSTLDNKTRQRKWNPLTRDTMIAQGVDPTLARCIFNVFYLSLKENPDKLQDLLVFYGYKLHSSEHTPIPNSTCPWTLIVTKTEVPDVSTLDQMTDECIEHGASIGEEYDGWYVEVT